MTRYLGGLITADETQVIPANNYENTSAPGIWTLSEAEMLNKQGLWPTAGVAFTRGVLAGGDIGSAIKLAGYAEGVSPSQMVTALKEEILEATQTYMARNAPKAAVAITSSLDDPTQLGIRDRMSAARELLDRTGLIKTEKGQVETSGGVMLMPPKNKEE